MKRFAPAFVVTVSSLCPVVALPAVATALVACHKDETDPSMRIGNPPGPAVTPVSTAALTAALTGGSTGGSTGAPSESVTFTHNPPFVREPPRIGDGNDAGKEGGARVNTPTPVSSPLAWSGVRAYSVTLNANVDGNPAYVGADGTCFVKLPFDHPLNSWQPSPTKNVACPPSMRDPLWGQCVGGSVMAKPGRVACVCTSDGNPPPPPHTMACPQ